MKPVLKRLNQAFCVFYSLFILSLPVSAQALPHLQAELLKMAESDQLERTKVQPLMLQLGANAPEVIKLMARQQAIDTANSQRLQEIINEYGWPGFSLVGKQGAQAAFLILQHAEYKVQKKYLPLLKAAFLKGDMPGQAFALLQDRVLMHEGKPQIYGTQLKSDATGALVLWPIEDEAHVDQRRTAMGLPSMEAYLKLFNLEYTFRPEFRPEPSAEPLSSDAEAS